jgi:hypothetical protein
VATSASTDPFFGGKDACHHCLKAAQWASSDFDRLSYVDLRIDRHGLIGSGLLLKSANDIRVNGRDIIAELHDALDAWKTLHSPPLR